MKSGAFLYPRTLIFDAGENVTDEYVRFLTPGDINGDATWHCRRTTGAWTAATLGIQGSVDGLSYFPLKSWADYIGGSLVTDEWLSFDAPVFPFMRLWSHNGSGVSVNQIAEEQVQVYLTYAE